MRTRLDRQELTRERERAGYTKSQFARAVGVSPGYVTDMEHGRRTPSPPVLHRMAAALDVDPAALLAEGPPPAAPAAPSPPARFDPLVGTPTEAAVRLGVSVGQVHAMIRDGLIPTCPLGRRKIGIPWAALEARLNAEAASSLAPYCPRCPCPGCVRLRRGEAS